MRLLDEIVDLLSSSTPNLENALFKTQVLAHRLGEEDLKCWVASELKGYPTKESVPPYRVIPVTVLGNISNGVQQHGEFPLPTMKLREPLRTNLERTHLVQSITVIEQWSKSDNNLSVVLAPELYGELSKGLGNGFFVQRAWGKHSVGAMLQVVVEVRSRLLDLAMQVADRIPKEPETADLKEVSREASVSDLFKNAVFGPNTTIVVGSGSIRGITNTVFQNDMESLLAVLRQSKVAEEDLASLRAAIASDSDAEELQAKAFGPAVRNWIGNAVKRAASGAWQVGVGAAGNIVATALGAYYGFGA